MKMQQIIGLALAAGLTTGCASAARYDDYRYQDENSFTVSARVLSAEPVYDTVRINEPETRCWNEPVSHRSREPRSESYTPTIAGAIIGGAVGNQFGKGDGRDLMTAAGMLLGGSIGNDLGKKPSGVRHYATRERRCETYDNYRNRRELVGYNVQYEFRGNTFWTRTQTDPGDYLKLRVDITPVE